MNLPDSKQDKVYLKRLLTQLRDDSPHIFKTLLRRCDSYKGEDPDGILAALTDFGILEITEEGGYSPQYASFCISDFWFLTDTPQRPLRDSVFPLYPESVFFVNQMNIPIGAKALDVCTGCGIYAAFATRFTENVTAIDINPRALNFAKYNLELNGLEDRVELLQGDLLAPVEGRTFDYISANPPFEPTPPGAFNYIHSDGGKDGLDTVKRILKKVMVFLSVKGCFEMLSFSLGGHKGLLLTNKCSPPVGTYASADIVFPPVSLKSFVVRYYNTNIDVWFDALTKKGLDTIHLIKVKIVRKEESILPTDWKISKGAIYNLNKVDWTKPYGK